MDNAIWALFYDISPEDKAEYLHWFHSQHIPDKLQRDGYLWAAHYQVVDPGGKFRPILDRLHYSEDFSLCSGAGYMALFGGQTTRTFYDPSPDQLKLQQDELTRDMISKRIKPVSIIYCEEWRVHGPLPKTSDFLQSAAPVIQIGRFDSVGSELDLGAWYAQERMCAIENTQGCIGARKLLASAGRPKHSILYEFDSMESRESHFLCLENTQWTRRIHEQIIHPKDSPLVGSRIWPEAL